MQYAGPDLFLFFKEKMTFQLVHAGNSSSNLLYIKIGINYPQLAKENRYRYYEEA